MKKVLIVEDEQSQLFVLEKAVKEFGAKPLTARDGREGYKIALEEKPDLILSDIIMPHIDGIEMIKKLRQDDWGKNANIIVLTNLSNKEAEMIESGIYTYIIKAEVGYDELVQILSKHLK